MPVRRCLILVALALFGAGCADDRYPTAVQPPPAAGPHLLRWAGPVPPQFSAVGAVSSPTVNGGFLAFLSSGISLDQYTARFWAVRGQDRSVQINYVDSTGHITARFLQLAKVDPVYVPDRGYLAPGDSVLIAVTIDPIDIKVSFEPTGLRFDDPAELQISYGGAGGDLNGDGVVDDRDAYIEGQLLGMWYREGADAGWTRISASQSVSDKSFTSALAHFSQYAVSW